MLAMGLQMRQRRRGDILSSTVVPGETRQSSPPMSSRLPVYTDAAWLAALRGEGEGCDRMVMELGGYLRRVLGTTLRRRALPDEVIEELTQEALSQLLGSLHTFRGDSAFSTWAAAVATRVAFTELRRRDARAEQHASFQEAQRDALEATGDLPGHAAEVQATRKSVLDALHQAIDGDLTEKQRIATLALLRGVPTIEIAEQLDSNQNAVYKLVHDARLRLRDALERRGVTPEVVDEISSGEVQP